MPELPEVERARKFLQLFLIHPKPKTIQSIQIFNSSIIKDVDPEEFRKTIQGQTFTEVGRYGKFLFLKLQTHTIISHLKLQGKYRFRKKLTIPKKHQHIHFNMTDKSTMAYCDVIRLGGMHLVPKGQEMKHKLLQKMGPQVHKADFNTDYMFEKCKKRKTTIKQILLNQNIVSGIGNKWADQILYEAKIHPETQAGKLTYFQIQQLVIISKKIIEKALHTSRRFTRLYAYNKTNRPCNRCKTKIQKIRVGERGAHFCPSCQVVK